MCIILYKPAGVEFPSMTELRNCDENNPDGMGMMWRESGSVRVRKGFKDIRDLLEFIRDNETDLIRADVGIHFRFATHGGKSPECCHPFPISGNNKLIRKLDIKLTNIPVLMHNGIISAYSGSNSKKTSDTMFFVKRLAGYKEDQYRAQIKPGDGRFLIFGEHTHVIGHWIYEDGVFWSNESYEYTYSYYRGCGAKTTSPAAGVDALSFPDNDVLRPEWILTTAEMEDMTPDEIENYYRELYADAYDDWLNDSDEDLPANTTPANKLPAARGDL